MSRVNLGRARGGLFFGALTLGWLIIAGLCYHDTNCTFLRAESGWYQAVVHASKADRTAAVREFLFHSHHGHYMPFAVLAEIEMTRLLGMNPTAWKWRAIAVIALLGGVLSSVTYRVAMRMGGGRRSAAACALVLTTFIILHPQLREFVAFPTLVFQLSWMVLFVITLGALLEAAAQPAQVRWLWVAVACAYASMHMIGLGAITAAATAAALGLGVAAAYSGKFPALVAKRRHWSSALLVLLVLGSVHLAAMQLLHSTADSTQIRQPLRMTSILSFTASVPVRVVESFLNASSLRDFSEAGFASAWPFGLLLIVLGLGVWIGLLRRTFDAPAPERLARCLMHTMTFSAFVAFVVLIAARIPFEPEAAWFRSYLSNPRYVVPATLIFLPSGLALATMASQRRGLTLLLASIFFSIAAFAANETYNHGVYQTFPTARLKHQKTWKRIAEMARESRAAGLPVPDLPTRALGEFPWHLHNYEPLLRYSLGLTSTEEINYVDWENLDAAGRDRYLDQVPTLYCVLRNLKLVTRDWP